MHRFLFLLVALLVSAVHADAYACSCMRQTLEEGAAQAQAIFEGQVTRIGPNTATSFRGVEVEMAVKRAWKGIETNRVTVITASNSAACGYGFMDGITYLVYAYRENDDRLRVSLCSLTKPIDDAKGDLKHLGEPAKDFTGSGKSRRSRDCSASSIESSHVSSGLLLWAALLLPAIIRRRRSQSPT